MEVHAIVKTSFPIMKEGKEAIKMKRLIPFLTIILLIWTPYGSQGSVPEFAVNSKGASINQQREQYQKEIETKLRKLDQEISALKAKAPEEGNELRKQFQQEMAELHQKRALAQRKFDKFTASSQQAWRDMKPGVDKAINDLEAAYKRAASDFK
jgi:glucose-6-phosphate-specific signal transduction histidine kinase